MADEERTEKPTPKRIRELRKKNTVLRSPELAAGVGLLVLVGISPLILSAIINSMRSTMILALSQAGTAKLDDARNLFINSGMDIARAVAPWIAVVMAATAATNFLIAKGKPNIYAIKPKFDSLNPRNGIKRVFGTQGLTEAGKGLLKLTAISVLSWFLIVPVVPELMSGSVEGWMQALGQAALRLLWASAAVALLVGVIDLLINRKRYNKQSRMSKNEVKQEAKSEDGDPLLRAMRRARAQQLSRARMIEDVSTASVVLTNPTHIAIALKYEAGDPAPKVVARGAGVIAERIKAKASEAGVPIRQDIPLARALFKACRVGDLIPAELYQAVAVILAAIFTSSRKVNS